MQWTSWVLVSPLHMAFSTALCLLAGLLHTLKVLASPSSTVPLKLLNHFQVGWATLFPKSRHCPLLIIWPDIIKSSAENFYHGTPETLGPLDMVVGTILLTPSHGTRPSPRLAPLPQCHHFSFMPPTLWSTEESQHDPPHLPSKARWVVALIQKRSSFP